LARHRSPRGAQSDDPDRTLSMRVVGVPAPHGARRRPTPPPASTRGRALVVAAAAGGVVAGAQSALLVPAPPVDDTAAVAALLPVVGSSKAMAGAPPVVAIGGDQAPLDPLTLGSLDATSEVDVANLTKAVDIGQELARQAAILDAARADGAEQATLVGDSAYVLPTEGELTSATGPRWGTTHEGLDIANRIATPIYAFTDGVVVESGPASGFGMWVVLQHPDGTRTVYGHINRTFVEVGDRVSAGEQIAEIGNRGRSTGPHLHFEVWDEDGAKLDPQAWLVDRGITV
jgi:biotin carboxyl carrier protein